MMKSEPSIIRTALSGKLRLELVYREYSESGLRVQVSTGELADSALENFDNGAKLPVLIEL